MVEDESSAEQAECFGLVWCVVDDASLAQKTARIARQLASFDPAVVGRFKHVINRMSLHEFNVTIENRMHAELTLAPAP